MCVWPYIRYSSLPCDQVRALLFELLYLVFSSLYWSTEQVTWYQLNNTRKYYSCELSLIFINVTMQVSWYRETMKLQEGDRVRSAQVGNSFSLSLEGVGQQDFATYSCRAENSLQREVFATLQISG